MNYKEFIEKFEVLNPVEYDNNVSRFPLVSVFVQTYQQVNYIEQCLNGLLSQKVNFEYEILLGDDYSSDGTREICKEYAQRYPDKIRLFLHHRENNIRIGNGPSGRFVFLNNLFSARGKYIAICEGDDYWTDPYKLQKQVDFLEANPEYVISFTNLNLYNHDLNEYAPAYSNTAQNIASWARVFDKPPVSFDIELLAKGNFIHTPTVVFRASELGEKIPDLLTKVTIGDWPLYMYLLRNGGRVHFLDECTAIYRVSDTGIFSKTSVTKKLWMSMGQYPYLINSGYFSDTIIAFWKEVLRKRFENLFSHYNDLSEDENIKNIFRLYFSEMPDFMLVVISDKNRNYKNTKNALQDIYTSKAYRLAEKLRRIKRIFS